MKLKLSKAPDVVGSFALFGSASGETVATTRITANETWESNVRVELTKRGKASQVIIQNVQFWHFSRRFLFRFGSPLFRLVFFKLQIKEMRFLFELLLFAFEFGKIFDQIEIKVNKMY